VDVIAEDAKTQAPLAARGAPAAAAYV